MAISKVVSIEITDSVTRVCELSYGKKIITVYNTVMFENPEYSVEDAVVVEDSEYVPELKKQLKEAKIKCKDAVFVLTSNRILSREISIPDMKEKLIADYIEGEKNQYFPMDISEHKLTYCIAGRDEQKKELKLIVYAAPYELIRSYQMLAKSLDVKIVKLDYIGNTEYKHLQVNNSNSKLDFYIEINESNTLFTILENGKYALQRNMNFGAMQLVRHLMDEGYYGPIEAKGAMSKLVSENLIFGSYSEMAEYSPSDEADARLYECRKRITDAVRPLISGVARVLEYYNNRNKDVSIGEIYAGGCGAQVKGILELITSEFEGVRFKKLAKLPGIKYSKANGLMVNRSTEFMSCIGASHISGIDFNITEVSAGKQSQTFAVLALLLAFAVAGALVGIPMFNYYSEINRQDSLNRQISDLAEYEQLKNDRETKTANYEELKNFVDSTVTNNQEYNATLAKIESLIPSNTVISSVTADNEGVTLVVSIPSKEESAKLLMQLGQIEEFDSVIVNNITENSDEDMLVKYHTFTVLCTYPQPEPIPEPQDESGTDEEGGEADE